MDDFDKARNVFEETKLKELEHDLSIDSNSQEEY